MSSLLNQIFNLKLRFFFEDINNDASTILKEIELKTNDLIIKVDAPDSKNKLFKSSFKEIKTVQLLIIHFYIDRTIKMKLNREELIILAAAVNLSEHFEVGSIYEKQQNINKIIYEELKKINIQSYSYDHNLTKSFLEKLHSENEMTLNDKVELRNKSTNIISLDFGCCHRGCGGNCNRVAKTLAFPKAFINQTSMILTSPLRLFSAARKKVVDLSFYDILNQLSRAFPDEDIGSPSEYAFFDPRQPLLAIPKDSICKNFMAIDD